MSSPLDHSENDLLSPRENKDIYRYSRNKSRPYRYNRNKSGRYRYSRKKSQKHRYSHKMSQYFTLTKPPIPYATRSTSGYVGGGAFEPSKSKGILSYCSLQDPNLKNYFRRKFTRMLSPHLPLRDFYNSSLDAQKLGLRSNSFVKKKNLSNPNEIVYKVAVTTADVKGASTDIPIQQIRTETINYEIIRFPASFDSNLRVIKEKIEEFNFPFYQIDLGSIYHQFMRWKRLLPRIQPFYAIKCQPDPKIISLLGQLGAGFDCASKHEIEAVIKAMSYNSTEAGKNIIFANPYKFKSDLHYANSAGVTTVTFDTENELLKLSKEWPNVKLVLRLSPPRTYDASFNLGARFGVDADEVVFLLQRAKDLSMDVIGVSFHVGSGCNEMDAFPETVIYCSQVLNIARQIGFNPTLVDIGGGFPGLSSINANLAKQIQFDEMCIKLNDVIDKYFPEEDNIKIIAEPGRYFVYGAYTLVTQVIGKRDLNVTIHKDDNDENNNPIEKGYRYVINDGIYNSFNCIFFDHAKPNPYRIFDNDGNMRITADETELFVSTVYGPTCDIIDCVMQEERLPKMDVGNWIVWPDMGAYTIAASSCFNGIQMAKANYFMYEEDALQFENNKLKKYY